MGSTIGSVFGSSGARAEEQAVVRRQVQNLLGGSRAYQSLSAAERSRISQDTTAVVASMAQRARAPVAPARRDPYAVSLDDSSTTDGSSTESDAGSPSDPKDFGTALKTGVHQGGQMLREVGFPDFVASLVKGVFQAIVQSSIDQMRAYGELVNSVAMSLSDFRDQNVTENQGRDHLVAKYPNLFQISASGDTPRVTKRPGADPDELPNFRQDFNLSMDITDLDDETIEGKLVPAARDSVAVSRQKLLATTVMMGINRIVVTDGRINAKLVYNFKATDDMKYHDTAVKYDHVGDERSGKFVEGTFPDGSHWAKGADNYSSKPIIQVSDTADLRNNANLQANAEITSDVSINFKSETFPLEKMVNTDQLVSLQAAQSGAGRGALAPTPPVAPALPPESPPPAPAAPAPPAQRA
jgi:hypothetical protein